MSENLVDQLAELAGLVGTTDMGAFVDALAASGIDVAALDLDGVTDLFDGVHGQGGDAPGEIRFGWEGRYAPGTDSAGNAVIQGSTGPPVVKATGAEVSPNDVTWS